LSNVYKFSVSKLERKVYLRDLDFDRTMLNCESVNSTGSAYGPVVDFFENAMNLGFHERREQLIAKLLLASKEVLLKLMFIT
jgi:hypothetical protein